MFKIPWLFPVVDDKVQWITNLCGRRREPSSTRFAGRIKGNDPNCLKIRQSPSSRELEPHFHCHVCAALFFP
jgi:hypothetical protein